MTNDQVQQVVNAAKSAGLKVKFAGGYTYGVFIPGRTIIISNVTGDMDGNAFWREKKERTFDVARALEMITA